ncbi:unnamed protein product [Chironomus riparius]|uniref:Uncharacterized protein n=1 Tax=Chironomus riparius TaxID=315576 RepID=A0A9N9WRX2_9DIPT|nr:unnamed protein product [Chironomus riparius]
MCITFLYTRDVDSSSNYKLILINNRDEFYARKTLKAKVKIDEGLIQIFGTDVEGLIHGTWLAISKKNGVIKIGNLLNLPGEKVLRKKTELQGRGPIALDFIRGTDAIEVHNKKLCDVSTNYNSFNFLSVEITTEYIKTLFTNNATQSYVELKPGVAGVSNSPISTPLKKVVAGEKKFHEIIQDYEAKNKDLFIDQLMNLLKWSQKHYPDDELLRRRGKEAEFFSSIHVSGHDLYGSRTRTIILVDKFDNIDYIEETITNFDDPDNPIWERTRFLIEDDSVIQCS